MVAYRFDATTPRNSADLHRLPSAWMNGLEAHNLQEVTRECPILCDEDEVGLRSELQSHRQKDCIGEGIVLVTDNLDGSALEQWC